VAFTLAFDDGDVEALSLIPFSEFSAEGLGFIQVPFDSLFARWLRLPYRCHPWL